MLRKWRNIWSLLLRFLRRIWRNSLFNIIFTLQQISSFSYVLLWIGLKDLLFWEFRQIRHNVLYLVYWRKGYLIVQFEKFGVSFIYAVIKVICLDLDCIHHIVLLVDWNGIDLLAGIGYRNRANKFVINNGGKQTLKLCGFIHTSFSSSKAEEWDLDFPRMESFSS